MDGTIQFDYIGGGLLILKHGFIDHHIEISTHNIRFSAGTGTMDIDLKTLTEPIIMHIGSLGQRLRVIEQDSGKQVHVCVFKASSERQFTTPPSIPDHTLQETPAVPSVKELLSLSQGSTSSRNKHTANVRSDQPLREFL